MNCKCTYWAGDGDDNTLRILFKHHPGCDEVKDKIGDRLEFISNLNYICEIYSGRVLATQLSNLEKEAKQKFAPKVEKEVSEEKLIRKFYKQVSKDHFPIASNCYLFDWESDILSVNKTGYIAEYEIKISRSDFKADVKKTEKHRLLKSVADGIPVFKSTPNYFYYLTPKGLLKPEEIPEYAGWVELEGFRNVKKKAPLLHRNKITEEDKVKLIAKMYYKYWDLKK